MIIVFETKEEGDAFYKLNLWHKLDPFDLKTIDIEMIRKEAKACGEKDPPEVEAAELLVDAVNDLIIDN